MHRSVAREMTGIEDDMAVKAQNIERIIVRGC